MEGNFENLKSEKEIIERLLHDVLQCYEDLYERFCHRFGEIDEIDDLGLKHQYYQNKLDSCLFEKRILKNHVGGYELKKLLEKRNINLRTFLNDILESHNKLYERFYHTEESFDGIEEIEDLKIMCRYYQRTFMRMEMIDIII